MQGRIENKIITEKKIQNKISDMPDFMVKFYYSLNQKSHTTKFRYIGNVIRFLENITNGNINKLTVEQLNNIDSFIIEQYISKISYYNRNGVTTEIAESTKACIYSSLSTFFSFLANSNIIETNPFSKKIERPKIQENDVIFLTPEEVKEVENQIIRGVGTNVAKSKQEKWKFRDYLLFRIPVVNGLRVTALSEINIQDINLKKKTIRVTEKGNITKDVFIDEKTCMFIEMWLEQRKKLLESNKCDALFISSQKKRMTVRSIEYVISKYTQCIKDKKITPHKLRSTCGTNLYQAKKDIYLVASVLGHKTTEPTQRYAKIFEQDKRDAINTIASIYN